MSKTETEARKEALRSTIVALRPQYKGQSDLDIARAVIEEKAAAPKKAAAPNGKINATDHVIPFVRKVKRFSTEDVAQKFNVSSGSAAALVAILRIKSLIESEGKNDAGVSLWRYTG
jgi:hypothetical protein